MFNKKAQGLSLGFIVAAAIAALVLVLIIAFTVGGLGGFFGQITGAGPTEIDTIRNTCSSNCDRVTGTIDSAADFENSAYAKNVFNIDVNGDGTIKGDGLETGLHCWDSPIDVSCNPSYTIPDGSLITCTVDVDTDTVSCPTDGGAPTPSECTPTDDCNTAGCTCPAATPNCQPAGNCA